MAYNPIAKVFEYSWMDSSAVFFIDPIYGPGESAQIQRKYAAGERITYQVPKLISVYNKYMHGVDVFDQFASFLVSIWLILLKSILSGYLRYSFQWC